MRTLTVSSIYRDTDEKRRPRRVPHVRLTGDWLAAAGFTPGCRISVHVAAGQLIIAPAAK